MAAVKKVKFLGERPEISFRNILFYMTKVTKIIVWRRFEPPCTFDNFFGNIAPMKYGINKTNARWKVNASCLKDYKTIFMLF